MEIFKKALSNNYGKYITEMIKSIKLEIINKKSLNCIRHFIRLWVSRIEMIQ
jgi:hypothetical protein